MINCKIKDSHKTYQAKWPKSPCLCNLHFFSKKKTCLLLLLILQPIYNEFILFLKTLFKAVQCLSQGIILTYFSMSFSILREMLAIRTKYMSCRLCSNLLQRITCINFVYNVCMYEWMAMVLHVCTMIITYIHAPHALACCAFVCRFHFTEPTCHADFEWKYTLLYTNTYQYTCTSDLTVQWLIVYTYVQ